MFIIQTKSIGCDDMITYEKALPMNVSIDRPDFKSYLLLDKEFQGTRVGLMSAMSYIRDSFMIHNDDFSYFFMQMGTKEITHMELISELLHQLHGSDDRYYDEDNDDTPTHELIPPLEKEECIKPMKQEHTNNDITACCMFHLQDEEKQIRYYQELQAKIEDHGAQAVFAYIIEGKKENVKILKDILHTLKEPNEIKDFGLGEDSHNAFSSNSGNYFDKPNPEFLNPSELDHLHK